MKFTPTLRLPLWCRHPVPPFNITHIIVCMAICIPCATVPPTQDHGPGQAVTLDPPCIICHMRPTNTLAADDARGAMWPRSLCVHRCQPSAPNSAVKYHCRLNAPVSCRMAALRSRGGPTRGLLLVTTTTC
jgi:hypothetical protein